MTFSHQQALSYAQTIAQPRRVGSEGERFAAEEITRYLEEFGYQVEHHPFQFISALHGWIRLELAIGSLLILAILILRTTSPWAPILPAILLLSMVFLVNSFHRWVQSSSLLQGDRSTGAFGDRILSWLGSKYKAINIVASIPDSHQDKAIQHLYLIAHYDSKSQTLPLPIRMVLFALYILGSVSVSGLTILSLFLPDLQTLIPYFAWGSIISGIPLLYMNIGNVSPGAIDNASGIGLILHLAELLAANQDLLRRLQVTFLFTAAEEEGLIGAMAYVVMNKAELRKQAQRGGVLILNFDGIGTQGKLLLNGSSKRQKKFSGDSIASWLREICTELDIPLGRFPPIGALMDHEPFAHHGFDAISLATAGSAAWSVHTRRDTFDKLHPNGFEQAGRVTLELIQRLTDKETSPDPTVEEEFVDPGQDPPP
jgi:hypothetical protein